MGTQSRDSRLDVWRGLCLVDVVLVHLAYNGLQFPQPLDDVIKHYTRFAAGGFVFLAGLTVAVVFGPAVEMGGASRRRAYVRLLRRAIVLLLVDVVASTALRLLDEVRLFPADPNTPLFEALRSIALFQRPGITGGIFLLYAVLLAMMPLVFEARRRIGSAGIAVLSVLAYTAALGTHGSLAWPPYSFPVLYWQPLFLAGFLSRPAHEWVGSGGVGRHRLSAGVAAFAFALMFALQYGHEWGLAPVQLDFVKTPLQLGALLWYLAAINLVIVWSQLLWHHMARSAAAGWLALLGRHSLLLYTAHVFTEIPLLEYVWGAWPGAAMRTVLGAIDVLCLSALATLVEARVPQRALASAGSAWTAATWGLQKLTPRLGGTLSIATTPLVVAATVLLLFLPGGQVPDNRDAVDTLSGFEPSSLLREADLQDESEPVAPSIPVGCDEEQPCPNDPTLRDADGELPPSLPTGFDEAEVEAI